MVNYFFYIDSRNLKTEVRFVLGGVMSQNYPNNPQGFGWFGGGNQYDNQYTNNNGPPPIPKTPSLFLPNFAPPVYFPNTFPYPNFNSFPFPPSYNNNPNGNGQHDGQNNGGGQNSQSTFNNNNPAGQPNHNHNSAGQHPHTPTVRPLPVQPLPSHTHGTQDVHNQLGSGQDKFLTNAFFGGDGQGTDNVNRHWTEDDELKWQATTKAPYFENKVPGLECTLPASAVLGKECKKSLS